MQYVQDYDEKYPSAYIETVQNPAPHGGAPWAGGVWFWQEILFPYTKSLQIYRCPSAPSLPAWAAGPYVLNYGVNRQLIRRAEDGGALSMSAVRRSAEAYMIMDSGGYDPDPRSTGSPWDFGVLLSDGWRYFPGANKHAGVSCLSGQDYTADCQSEGRHFDGVNVAFADGHAKWLKSVVVIREAQKFNISTHATSSWDPVSE